jgi:alcohol dehydrogenase
MRAIQFTKFGSPLELTDLPVPDPPAGGVLIKVEAAGLCRSDWHGWQGHDPDINSLPHVPGHEFSGTIAALGDGVSGWDVGGRVTAPFVCGCGSCKQCHSGNAQVCSDQYQPGFHGHGAFAEYVALPYAETNLVRLPDTVGFTAAAALGCRFATAFRAIVHEDQAFVQPDERVAVFGCGGVGLSAIMILKALGAKVIAIDINDASLSKAREIGADQTLLFDDARELEADVAIDALGSTATCLASIESLAPRGRHVQIGLMVADDATPPIPMGPVIGKELKLIGSHGMSAARYPEMLAVIAEGGLAPERLIGQRISLDEVPAHMESLGSFSGGAGAILIDRFGDGDLTS